jgi:ribosome biogenesis protein Tsr3
VAELNTVEALSAAVYILGRPEEAGPLIAGFRGGDEFLEVNRTRLDRYRQAALPADVADAERALFGGT